MLKLQVDTLSKILTPETLQSLGLKRIKEIKELGKQNNYHLLVIQEIHVHPENNLVIQHKEHATQRAEELSYCCRFQGLSEQEKNLLKTQIRFIDDEKIIRRVSLIGCPFWLIYNCVSGAYGSCVGDVLSIMSLVISMVRYDFKKSCGETN